MAEDNTLDLVEITADLTSAYLANNDVRAADVPELIRSLHMTLAGLGKVEQPNAPARPTGAVSPRKSLADPSRIISMIDGKAYKSLARHVGRHGYTPQSYREAFGLPADYPMTAPDYSETRRQLAKEAGLGRKRETEEAAKPAGRRGGLKKALAAAKSHLVGDDVPERGSGPSKNSATEEPQS